jgi:predicted PurR-regulated permease PerM
MQKIDKTIIYVIFSLFATTYFLYLVNDILTPFVVALVFSYFLAPVVLRLENFKIPRGIGILLAISSLFLIVILLSFTLIPVIYKQALVLIERISNHSAEIKLFSSSTLDKLKEIDPNLMAKAESTISDFSGNMLSIAGQILGKIFHSGILAINIIAIIFITPIVMFYMLLSWESFISSCQGLIPKKYRLTAKKLITNINTTLSGYLRGQTLVCFILGIFYATGLSIIGLESGIALGFISGLLVFVPYAGAIFSAVLCVIITAIQFNEFSHALLVAGLFAFGQVLEGNFLTPKLIGKSVGLNPVWIIFGLLSGGALLGFVGVLVALPLTAVLGVIIRFALSRYKESKFYN